MCMNCSETMCIQHGSRTKSEQLDYVRVLLQHKPVVSGPEVLLAHVVMGHDMCQ